MTDPADPAASLLTIRMVTPDDWRSHRDLRLEMLLDAPDAFWTQHSDVAHLDEEGWRRRIAGQHHLQGLLGDDPVGSVGLWEDPGDEPGTVTLVAMYVVPQARGRRIGERLVQAVLDEAADRGASRVVLQVTSKNDPAIRLYERMGFVFNGSREPHPRKNDLEELWMEHRVDPVPTAQPDVEG